MGHSNYANYSNTYHGTRDDLKRWPITLPFSGSLSSNGTVTAGSKLDGDVLKQLRQHVKAIDKQFLFSGTASLTNVSDTKIAAGAKIENEQLNANGSSPVKNSTGLLDGMSTNGILGTISGVGNGVKITKAKIDEIATKLKSAASYNNYSNYTNTGHANYTNGYANHSSSTSYSNRGWMCHRNHANHSNSGSNHLNTSVAYSNTSYSNSFTNPATYQNSL